VNPLQDYITITGAREHNLKNISLQVPKFKLVVLTGLSGSGKSTIAIDILQKEGQRQYMESLGMVDHASKPKIDSIEGLSPSICVDQHLTNRSPRSTVGTATEIFTYLRVMFARIGHRPCPKCGKDIPPSIKIGDEAWNDEDDESGETYPCPNCGARVPEPGMASFSFNKVQGACPTCTGLGVVHKANIKNLIDESRSILDGGVIRWDKYEIARYQITLQNAGRHYGFNFEPSTPIKSLGRAQKDLLLYGVDSPQFRRHYPDIEPPSTVANGRFEGVITGILRRYDEHADNAGYREKMEKLLVRQVCPDCKGDRLKPESRSMTVGGKTIIELSRMPIDELSLWLDVLWEKITRDEKAIVEPIYIDLKDRIKRLVDVGVGYLTMERSSLSLSAGEAQRLRLAALLGSGLTGVLYVLDEPTIGLHPRDTGRLIKVLKQLRDQGNTVLVIEHDLDMMMSADHIIDIGPGAGKNGGKVIAAGTPEDIALCSSSITGNFLSGRSRIEVPEIRRKGNGKCLTIKGARENNLKNITVSLPSGMLIAITGVSGSGKSSLMFDILDRAARQHFYGSGDIPGEHDTIEGLDLFDNVITIDQTAIGRVPRSNAATYTDAFTPIREVFAATEDAKNRKLSSGHFSFNVPGGRCERCEGSGVLTVPMHFLPPVEVRCPSCHGRRFKKEVLEAKYKGYDISSILDMTIEEALPIFKDVPAAASKLSLMVEVGMGYLQMGQPATTLSGGEAQRVKLARELGRRAKGRTLYLLDEPTTGLHPGDVSRLIFLLQRLVDAGNTVVVVEHNLDIIKVADHVIDLGPGGGQAGGMVIGEGTPEDISKITGSYTGKYLQQMLTK
jgi:excinuclease ABC subunit A